MNFGSSSCQQLGQFPSSSGRHPKSRKVRGVEPVHCVRVQGRSKETPATIKRHPAQIRYNSQPWNWQPQQLRQRLTPQRRIQSSGEFGRSVRTTSGATCAGIAAAPASACMTSGATIARNAAATTSASTARGAICAGIVVAPAYASTASGAPDAQSATAPASVSMASSAPIAPSARTYHAQWKVAHNSATVSAQPESCGTTCAPSTAASPRRSPSPRS